MLHQREDQKKKMKKMKRAVEHCAIAAVSAAVCWNEMRGMLEMILAE